VRDQPVVPDGAPPAGARRLNLSLAERPKSIGPARPCAQNTSGASRRYGDDVDRDGALASRIAAHHGLAAEPVAELTGLGSVNRVFTVGLGNDRCVIRFAIDPLRSNEFMTEAWCLELVASHGIPSPVTLASGTLHGVPYAVQRFVPHVARDRVSRRQLWETLGGYARRINELPVPDDAPAGLFTRFGRDLSAAWRAHLAYNLAELTRGDPLIALGVYPREEQPRLRDTILGLAETCMRFGLSHGDLAARNVLVGLDRAPVLMDWGSATCGPVPYTDLLILYRDHEQDDDPSADDLAAFGAGYGVDLGEIGPTVDAVRRLSAVDLVRWAAEHRRDRLPALVDSARRELARRFP
jgi:Ser/Thr protein kinase RdoA (MazF antagonist)